MQQLFTNPFRRNNTVKKANNKRNNTRNNTFDKYIMDNEDDLLDEVQIQRYMKHPVAFNSGRRNNAVRRVLRELISSHALDSDVEGLLLEYIIKKNSGLTTNQKANFLLYKTSPENISKLVRNIRNRPNRTRNNRSNSNSDPQ
jgi:hypothetical protein